MTITEDLIDRIQTAKAQESWVTNSVIAQALGWTQQSFKCGGDAHCMVQWVQPDGTIADTLQNYTGDFEAALKTLPDGAQLRRIQYRDKPDYGWEAQVWSDDDSTFGEAHDSDGTNIHAIYRAIIVAGLRARRAAAAAKDVAA